MPDRIPGLEVTIRVRNNHLVRRRTELGLSQAAFARAISMSVTQYNAFETLRRDPRMATGQWRPSALRIAAYHHIPPDELWPEALSEIREPVVRREVDVEDLHVFLEQTQSELLLPDERMMKAEQATELFALFETLEPRHQSVLTKRLGLDGVEPQTLKEIGDEVGLSVERIRQIERRALRLLRGQVDEQDHVGKIVPVYPWTDVREETTDHGTRYVVRSARTGRVWRGTFQAGERRGVLNRLHVAASVGFER